MTAVTIVGMGAGGILVLTAVAVFLNKKEFPAGGVLVTMIGLVLIGMSQWSSIKISGAGFTLETLANQITETAAAAEEVAAQAEQTAAEIETTKRQLVDLTTSLNRNRVISPAVSQEIRNQLSAVPNVDRSRLDTARKTLGRLSRPKE